MPAVKDKPTEAPTNEPKVSARFDVPPRNLPCRITEEEKREAGQMIAAEVQDLLKTQERKKEAASQFKAEEEQHNSTIRQLSIRITSEFEYRAVDCERINDYEAAEVNTYRKDTGELVHTRRMTSTELQLTADMDEQTTDGEESETAE